MVGWVDGWGGQIAKNQIYLDLIEIFQFCLKIRHGGPPPMGGCMDHWVG